MWTRPRALAAAASVLVVLVWQVQLFRGDWPETFALKAASGLQSQNRFVYFLYYLNLFPVASLDGGRDQEFYFDDRSHDTEPDRLTYSRAAAERTIAERGETLVMEWGHSMRFGSHLQTYLYLPDAWRLGSPQYAELRIATSAVYLIGLLALVVAAWWADVAWLGLALVVLLGSNPFQLYEAYRREEVFGWPIAMFSVVLALMLPLMAGAGRRGYHWWAAAVSGVALGTAYHIRMEAASVVAGVPLVLLALPRAGWARRVALTVTFLAVFVLTAGAWGRYFDAKWSEAAVIVRNAGGHVYDFDRAPRHQIWGSLWSGLGDFDTTHGYSWRDDDAVRYAEGVLMQQYGERLPWWWGTAKTARTPEDYFDTARIYYRHPLQTPHQLDVMRDKVLADLQSDPLWFVGILLKRVWRVLTQTTPLQLTLSPAVRLPIPFSGLLAIPILAAAIVLKDGLAIRLLLFALPLSATAIAIYSGGNTPHYSVYHIVAAAILVAWAARFARRRAA